MGNCGDTNNNRLERASSAQRSNSTFYSSTGISSFMNNNIMYNKFISSEEYYYKKIKDSNTTNLLKSTNSNPYSRKLEIFFSLNNVANPSYSYSFSLTIINNANLGIRSYLGDLEQNSGENIDFGNSFEIDFFPDRKQILLIKPIINKAQINYETNLTVLELIQKNHHEALIPNVGLLKLTYKFLNLNQNPELEKYFSNFKFVINLYNINQACSQGIFFVLNHYKDPNKKRAVYKSQIFYTDEIKTKTIKIE